MCTSVSLDSTKAFDKLWRSGLFYKLINKIDPTLWRAIYSYYKESKIIVKINNKTSKVYRTTEDCKQGGISSPHLFNFFICLNLNDICVTVKSFMNINLANELVEIFEKIFVSQIVFIKYKEIQTLLISIAIIANRSRRMEYIKILDNYDGQNIAEMAISTKLNEEAFAIFKKVNKNSAAIKILTDNIKDLDRASVLNLIETYLNDSSGARPLEIVKETNKKN